MDSRGRTKVRTSGVRRTVVRACALATLVAFLLPSAASAVLGGPILYTYHRGDWSDVFTIDPATSTTAEITREGVFRYPSWAPDGSRIVYAKTTGHPAVTPFRQIWTMRADGRNDLKLRTWARDITALDWGPNSRYLAVGEVDPSTATYRLVRFDIRTGSLKTLYKRTGSATVSDIDWSPNGSAIMFVVKSGNTYRAYVVDVSSGAVKPAPVSNAANLSWSSASGRVAARVRSSSTLSRLRIADSGNVTTVFSATQIGGVSWAPDDSRLVFDGRLSDVDYGLYTMNPDGTGRTRILGDFRYQYPKFVARSPEWRPSPSRDAAVLLSEVASTCDYAGPASLRFQLIDESGTPLAGRTVYIQSSSDAKVWETPFSARVTDAEGRVSATGEPTRRRYYRAFFAGDAGYGQCVSSIRTVFPRVYLTTPSTPATVSRDSYFTVSGYLKPRHEAGSYPVRLNFYRRESNGDGTYSWVLRRIAQGQASDYSSYSRYNASVSLPYSGSWRVRTYHEADSANAATYSSYRYLTVE